MSIIRELYARFRHLIHEGFKFLVIGAVGTIITFGVANALHDFGKYKAVTAATILATVVTFLGNRHWTFRHRQGQGTTRESIIFFILNGIGLLIYYGCIGVTDLFGLSGKLWYNMALVVGTILGTLFRFWSYRKWVWIAPATVAPVPADDMRPEGDAAAVGQTGRDRDLAAVGPATAPGQARPGHGPGHFAQSERFRDGRRTPAGHRRRS